MRPWLSDVRGGLDPQTFSGFVEVGVCQQRVVFITRSTWSGASLRKCVR